jgi:hypothetical protein
MYLNEIVLGVLGLVGYFIIPGLALVAVQPDTSVPREKRSRDILMGALLFCLWAAGNLIASVISDNAHSGFLGLTWFLMMVYLSYCAMKEKGLTLGVIISFITFLIGMIVVYFDSKSGIAVSIGWLPMVGILCIFTFFTLYSEKTHT